MDPPGLSNCWPSAVSLLMILDQPFPMIRNQLFLNPESPALMGIESLSMQGRRVTRLRYRPIFKLKKER